MRRPAAARPGRWPQQRTRSRAGTLVRRAALVLLALLVFALGIAVGEALHDNPKPGGTATLERTFSVPPGSKTFTP